MNKMNKRAAATGLRPYTLGFAALFLFIFCMIGFSLTFLSVQNPTSDIFNSKYQLNQSFTRLNNSLGALTSFSNDLQTTMQSTENSQPSPTTYLFLIFQGAFYIPYKFVTFIADGIMLLKDILFMSIGLAGVSSAIQIVIGAIIAGLLITVILFVIKAIRTGDVS